MTTENVLIVGGGAREHALAERLSKSPEVRLFYTATPELLQHRYVNPGLKRTGTRITGPVLGDRLFTEHVLRRAREMRAEIRCVVIGPDDPIADGLADQFLVQGKLVFAPTQLIARMEASKAFMQELAEHHGIPIPQAIICHSAEWAERAVVEYTYAGPTPVLKPDGLTRGKGVCVPETPEHAREYIRAYFQDPHVRPLLVAQRIIGPELSLHALCDGTRYVLLPSVRDYKPIWEGNRGPMTGGMGCVSSSELITPEEWEALGRQFVAPILEHWNKQDPRGFRGGLFVNLIRGPQGWMALEYNVRFGDPETQALLPLLTDDIDFYQLLRACASGSLESCVGQDQFGKVLPHQGHTVVITIADKDYPAPGEQIHLPMQSTRTNREGYVSLLHGHGTGRVGSVVAYSKRSLKHALECGYAYANDLSNPQLQYRRDIGAELLTP